jgi:hypothetical protein
MQFILKPCRTGRDFNLEPKKKIKLDLKKLASSLPADFTVKTETPFILLIEYGGLEILVYPNARLLVRKAESEEQVLKAGEEVSRFF